MGLAIRILKEEARPVCRSIMAHGAACAPEVPAYLREMPVALSPRALRKWAEELGRPAEEIKTPEIWAGNSRAIEGMEKFFATGTLGLQTAVASDAVGVIRNLATWLPGGVAKSPVYSTEERSIGEMPRYLRKMLVAAEEYRVAICRESGDERVAAPPGAPSTQAEVKMLVCRPAEMG